MSDKAKSARPQLLLVAAVFFGPLLLAAVMYYGGAWSPADGRTNNGALLEPIVNVPAALPDSGVPKVAQNQWLMLYMDEGDCDDACLQALHTLRQIRLMLGKEMGRVARVFLRGESVPDTVTGEEQNAGLIIIRDEGLGVLLDRKRPRELPAGGVYLLDPLGNLVMYFPPDLDPKDTVRDIKHLLKLSNIG